MAEILKRLLSAEKDSGESLIDSDELAAIAQIWAEEGLNRNLVFRLWRHVYEGGPMPNEKDDAMLSREDKLLEEVCRDEGLPLELMRKLRDLEEEFGALKRRHGLPDQMRDTVRQFLTAPKS